MKTSLTTLCARLLLLAMAGAACSAHAGFNPPSMVSYQGYLTDGTGAPLGNTNTGPKNYALVFKIYNSQTGSATNNLLYSEQQIVTVDKGYFSCVLGIGTVYSTDPHPDLTLLFPSTLATPLYVETTVLGTPNIVILPRLQLVTSPFSFLANNAVNAQNLINSSNSSVLTISGNSLTIGNTNSYLNVNGTINATAANITGAINAGSATITNTVTAGTVSAAIVYAGTATVTNAFTAGSASIPGAINAGSATVTNTLTAANAVITNTLTAGTLQATTVTVTNLTVTGTNSAAYFRGNAGGLTNVVATGDGSGLTNVVAYSDEPVPLRIVRGSMASDPQLTGVGYPKQNGWTGRRAGIGVIVVTFTRPFSEPPTVVASVGAAGQTFTSLDAVSVAGISTTNFVLYVGIRGSGSYDEPVSFIAIGPR